MPRSSVRSSQYKLCRERGHEAQRMCVVWERRTLEVGALLLPEAGARLLHAAGEAALYILRHGFFCSAHLAGALAVAHHMLHALDAPVAVVEGPRYALGELLYLAFLGLLGLFVIEARQYVFLVQALQLLAVARNAIEQLCDFIRDIGPPRGKQIHLDHGVAIFDGIVRPGGEQATAVLVGGEQDAGAGAESGRSAEAIVRRAGRTIALPVRRVVGVRLPVGDVEVRAISPHGGRRTRRLAPVELAGPAGGIVGNMRWKWCCYRGLYGVLSSHRIAGRRLLG